MKTSAARPVIKVMMRSDRRDRHLAGSSTPLRSRRRGPRAAEQARDPLPDPSLAPCAEPGPPTEHRSPPQLSAQATLSDRMGGKALV